MYKVYFLPSAARDAAKLSERDTRRLREAVAALREWPQHGRDVSKLRGKSEGEFRLRVGPFRVLFEVDSSERRIAIVRVRRRGRAYSRR